MARLPIGGCQQSTPRDVEGKQKVMIGRPTLIGVPHQASTGCQCLKYFTPSIQIDGASQKIVRCPHYPGQNEIGNTYDWPIA